MEVGSGEGGTEGGTDGGREGRREGRRDGGTEGRRVVGAAGQAHALSWLTEQQMGPLPLWTPFGPSDRAGVWTGREQGEDTPMLWHVQVPRSAGPRQSQGKEEGPVT